MYYYIKAQYKAKGTVYFILEQNHVRFGIWVNYLFLTEISTTVNILLLQQVQCELWGCSTEPWLPYPILGDYVSLLTLSVLFTSHPKLYLYIVIVIYYIVIVPKSVASEFNFTGEMYIFFMSFY